MALIQAPKAVVMVRPWQFHSNPETASDNAFQKTNNESKKDIALQARAEFDEAVEVLKSHGVNVHVFDDFGEKETPDSVFPNNWFSTHGGGHIAIYPMYSKNRRRERRSDIIEMLKSEYRVQDVIDFSGLEWDELFLEGTGAMVLDHINRIAYTAKSNRSNEIILERFCSHFQYEPVAFDTQDINGNAIYHTNVMMNIGTKFAIVCLEMIVDLNRREEIKARIEESGRTVIDISYEQVDNFSGNALELTGTHNTLLAISKRAYEALSQIQIAQIQTHATIVPLSVPTIELAGGSVRCMLAGIHLNQRKNNY